MLLLPTEATVEEKTNTCMDLHHPTYHWRPHKIQMIWIYASKHIIVNTANKQWDRKILNGKGSLGHWHVCYSLAVLLTFWWKTDCWMQAELIMSQGWPTQTKQAQHFSFSVKFTLPIDFLTEAIRIKQCMQLNHELWLTETNKAVVTQCPTGFKFSTPHSLYCWQNKGLS